MMRPAPAIILFAGPSLAGLDPSALAGIDLRPPAIGGDLLRTLAELPSAVALVDGVFETAPTVQHKEIWALLAEGVAVYGAASLGALRAAEMDRFGMIGVGDIYEAYRGGRIERDDAVMVAHAPAELGFRPLTLALVDAEAAIALGAIPDDDRAALVGIARRLNFRVRDWERIFSDFAAVASPERVERARQAIDRAAPGLKTRDCAALIHRLRTTPHDKAKEPTRPPETSYLRRLRAQLSAGATRA